MTSAGLGLSQSARHGWELVRGSGEIDSGCLIYRWLRDTMFPGEALSPCLILHYLRATGSVVVVELKILETIKRSGL